MEHTLSHAAKELLHYKLLQQQEDTRSHNNKQHNVNVPLINARILGPKG